jgi:hypothetical protein
MELQRCYEVLGIQAGASPEAVHQAYKTQVKFFHPDRFTDDPDQQRLAEERLKEVNAAYAALQAYQAQGPRETPPRKAPKTERSPERSAGRAAAADRPRPAVTIRSGTSLMQQLRAIGQRVAAGVGKALQGLRENHPADQQPDGSRPNPGCRRSAAGPRRSGRGMGRGGGGRRR